MERNLIWFESFLWHTLHDFLWNLSSSKVYWVCMHKAAVWTSWRQQLHLIILDQFCEYMPYNQYWKSCFSFSIFFSFLEFCITDQLSNVHLTLTVTAVQWFVINFILVSLNDKLPIIVNYSFILLLLPNLLPSCPIHVAHVVCHPNCLMPIHLSLNWRATQTSIHPGVASQEFQLSLTNCVTHLCKYNSVARLTKCPFPQRRQSKYILRGRGRISPPLPSLPFSSPPLPTPPLATIPFPPSLPLPLEVGPLQSS